MYSKSFVGDPKKREPSGFGTCGERSTSAAARYCGASSWGNGGHQADPVRGRDEGGGVPQDLANPGHEQAVAHEQEVHAVLPEPLRVFLDESPNGLREQGDAVPRAERPDEPAHHRGVGDAVAREQRPASLGAEGGRVEPLGIDAVRVHQDAPAIDPLLHQLLLEDFTARLVEQEIDGVKVAKDFVE